MAGVLTGYIDVHGGTLARSGGVVEGASCIYGGGTVTGTLRLGGNLTIGLPAAPAQPLFETGELSRPLSVGRRGQWYLAKVSSINGPGATVEWEMPCKDPDTQFNNVPVSDAVLCSPGTAVLCSGGHRLKRFHSPSTTFECDGCR